MFEYIRKHQRLMQILLAIIIVPSFVLVGVSSYDSGGSAATGVATVAGKQITQQEWDEAQRRQIDQARSQMGAQFDQKQFDTPQAKQAVLEQLVAERTLQNAITEKHLAVSDAAIRKQIEAIPQFRKADGTFDLPMYTAALAAQGMTPTMFDADLRRQMALQQLTGSIQATAIVPRSVTTRLSDLRDQTRDVQELLFPVADFVSKVQVTDAMVKAFYDKNTAMFMVPEHIKAEYIVFNADAVARQVTVSDAEIAEAYAKNPARFATAEERAVSHILVNSPKSASPADAATAKVNASAILAEVRKSPAEFANIAKAKSQDTGSAEMGGELGSFQKGVKSDLPAAVDAAVFALKEGEASELVQSEYGFHIIKVTSVKPATQKTLAQAHDAIGAELKTAKMSKKYSELAEQFANTVEEQSDSLKPAADKLGLKIETIENLGRTPSPQFGTAPFNNAKFLSALFAQDTLKNKRNTLAVEAAPSTLIAGRVVDYKPAAKRPLAEVDAAIRQRVTTEEAMRLARAAGEAKMAAAKAAGDAAGFGPVQVLTRTAQPTINPVAAMAVLKADTSKLPAYVGVDVPGQGYGVYRIAKVAQVGTPDPARRAQEAEQITGAAAQQDMYAFLQALKEKAKSKVTAKPVDASRTE
ncbi:SurA N-terminal domain-containing protein [Massilia sp. S19_KUP03_FR1]|uniref:SurA N-terminal domain-containing protein n=1 Tax=Massilia sp. S19_KUP03_FR1 TaxID=3025503 RepID=UPI002FCDA734